tara:strand:+ start:6633 stop:6794 length:162 start_codon:yes stop_codon:yes gene_type:complete
LLTWHQIVRLPVLLDSRPSLSLVCVEEMPHERKIHIADEIVRFLKNLFELAAT